LGICAIFGETFGLADYRDLDDISWSSVRQFASEHLRERVMSVFEKDTIFPSNLALIKIGEAFLSHTQVSEHSVHGLQNRMITMVHLFMRQLYVFAYLKNTINLSQKFLFVAKDRLRLLSQDWPHKKGFLEGAYKILLFRNVKFDEGKIKLNEDAAEESEPLQMKPMGSGHTLSERLENIQQHLESLKEQQAGMKDQSMQTDDVENGEKKKVVAEGENAELGGKVLGDGSESAVKKKEIGVGVEGDVESPEKKVEEPVEEVIQCTCYLHREGGFAQKPDYLIQRGAFETRVYIDQPTKLELLMNTLMKAKEKLDVLLTLLPGHRLGAGGGGGMVSGGLPGEGLEKPAEVAEENTAPVIEEPPK
jgi:hypothetical protein